ncbi:hypothetical protein [Xanthomonas graminis]|nr:hypothetical protein [Xanthomonas translucens]
MFKGLLLVALKAALAVQLIALPFFASAAVSSQVVVTESTYSATSSETQQVVLWLQQHTARVNGRPVGDFNQIGDITVAHSRETASDGLAHLQSPGDPPPTDLPTHAQPGDTYSVSSCSKGVSQTWSFVFVNNSSGGFWKLADYKYNTKACSGSSD